MGRAREAREDFFHPVLNGLDEAEPWRLATAAALGEAFRSSLDVQQMLAIALAYPTALRVPLSLQLIEAAVQSGSFAVAEALIEAIGAEANDAHVRGMLGVWGGSLRQAAGNVDSALEQWQEVQRQGEPASTTAAALAETLLLVKLARIDHKQAIERLESLRFAWRGDRLEFQILAHLGRLYIDDKQLLTGLRFQHQAVTRFGFLPEARAIREEMSGTFARLFLDQGGGDLKPVAAIALYDEFRDLVPADGRSTQIALRLADRLIAVDLLDRAAKVLEEQLRVADNAADKSRIGARLAQVKSLDRQPKAAVDALQASEPNAMPADLKGARQRLEAKAWAGLGEDAKALATIQGDTSAEAEHLRAEIHRKQRDWRAAAQALDRALAGWDPAKQPPTSVQSRTVIDLAVALALAGDDTALADVKRRFGPAMEKTTDADAFRLVATPRSTNPATPKAARDAVNTIKGFQAQLASRRPGTEPPTAP
jgi:tetratricopeptide (TPR) repeat protein